MGYKREIILNIVLLVFCMSVFLNLMYHGSKGRTYLDEPLVVTLPQEKRPLSIWEDSGVRGRILVLFDRKLHGKDDGALSTDNYVYRAIVKNIIRKVYHVIPDTSWSEVRENLSGNPYVISYRDVLSTTLKGTPLVILKAKDIPDFHERVIVHVNTDKWGRDGVKKISSIIRSWSIMSDLITMEGNLTAELKSLIQE